jgi:hypothetical protein
MTARSRADRRRLSLGVLLSVALLGGVSPRPAFAQVDTVTGSAFGFYASVGLFGNPAGVKGPAPTVRLAPEGSPEPVTESDPDGATAQYGPVTIVQTTAMTVSTQGTTGPDGIVTSSASVEFNANREEQIDPFNADNLMSTCSASEAGFTGSTTLNNASLVVSTDPDTQEPVETIDLPADPEPNTAFEGTIDHVGDRFRVVLNEQIEEGGTITVNAMHLYLLGNITVGDVVIGQAVCGINATAPGGGGILPSDTSASTETTDSTAAAPDDTTDASGLDETATAENDDGGGSGLLIGALVIGGLAIALVVKAVTGRREPE